MSFSLTVIGALSLFLLLNQISLLPMTFSLWPMLYPLLLIYVLAEISFYMYFRTHVKGLHWYAPIPTYGTHTSPDSRREIFLKMLSVISVDQWGDCGDALSFLTQWFVHTTHTGGEFDAPAMAAAVRARLANNASTTPPDVQNTDDSDEVVKAMTSLRDTAAIRIRAALSQNLLDSDPYAPLATRAHPPPIAEANEPLSPQDAREAATLLSALQAIDATFVPNATVARAARVYDQRAGSSAADSILATSVLGAGCACAREDCSLCTEPLYASTALPVPARALSVHLAHGGAEGALPATAIGGVVQDYFAHPLDPTLVLPPVAELASPRAVHTMPPSALECLNGLRYGDVHTWLCWALFYTHPPALSPLQHCEVALYVALLEHRTGVCFRPGFGAVAEAIAHTAAVRTKHERRAATDAPARVLPAAAAGNPFTTYARMPATESSAPGVRSMRVSLEPIAAVHRPLVAYAAGGVFQALAKLFLRAWGWRRTRIGGFRYWHKHCGDASSLCAGTTHTAVVDRAKTKEEPCKPAQATGAESTPARVVDSNSNVIAGSENASAAAPAPAVRAKKLSAEDYFDVRYVPSDRATEDADDGARPVPLVFIHGLGQGLSFYLPFIANLTKGDRRDGDGDCDGVDGQGSSRAGDSPAVAASDSPADLATALGALSAAAGRDVFLVEMSYIAGRVWEQVPSSAQVVHFFSTLLAAHGYAQAIFAGHSFGTFAVAWAVRFRPEMVRSALLIDPVSLCLCWPTTSYQFVYDPPKTFSEWVRFLVVSREMGVDRVMKRAFWWQEKCFFLQDLPHRGAQHPHAHELYPPTPVPVTSQLPDCPLSARARAAHPHTLVSVSAAPSCVSPLPPPSLLAAAPSRSGFTRAASLSGPSLSGLSAGASLGASSLRVGSGAAVSAHADTALCSTWQAPVTGPDASCPRQSLGFTPLPWEVDLYGVFDAVGAPVFSQQAQVLAEDLSVAPPRNKVCVSGGDACACLSPCARTSTVLAVANPSDSPATSPAAQVAGVRRRGSARSLRTAASDVEVTHEPTLTRSRTRSCSRALAPIATAPILAPSPLPSPTTCADLTLLTGAPVPAHECPCRSPQAPRQVKLAVYLAGCDDLLPAPRILSHMRMYYHRQAYAHARAHGKLPRASACPSSASVRVGAGGRRTDEAWGGSLAQTLTLRRMCVALRAALKIQARAPVAHPGNYAHMGGVHPSPAEPWSEGSEGNGNTYTQTATATCDCLPDVRTRVLFAPGKGHGHVLVSPAAAAQLRSMVKWLAED